MKSDWMKGLDWARIEQCLYVGLRDGWVSSRTAAVADTMSVIPVDVEDLRIVDRWRSLPSCAAIEGEITIYLVSRVYTMTAKKPASSELIPLWKMVYVGQYEPEAIPFLKRVLKTSYEKPGRFRGCRGPDHYAEGGFVYTNRPRFGEDDVVVPIKQSFHFFTGREEIKRDGKLVGSLAYFGSSMV